MYEVRTSAYKCSSAGTTSLAITHFSLGPMFIYGFLFSECLVHMSPCPSCFIHRDFIVFFLSAFIFPIFSHLSLTYVRLPLGEASPSSLLQSPSPNSKPSIYTGLHRVSFEKINLSVSQIRQKPPYSVHKPKETASCAQCQIPANRLGSFHRRHPSGRHPPITYIG